MFRNLITGLVMLTDFFWRPIEFLSASTHISFSSGLITTRRDWERGRERRREVGREGGREGEREEDK